MRAHLATLVDDFRRHGRATAVVNHVGNRRIPVSWAELAVLSGRFAAELERRGIAPGERVLLWGRNSAEWIAAFFGCVLRGVLVAPLDAAGGAGFARQVARETAPRLLAGDAALLGAFGDAAAPVLPFDAFATALPPPDYAHAPELDRSTPLQIIFTSGTTAAPKGIVHTHGNVLASLDPIESEIARYRTYERLVHPLRFLHTLPLSHVFGQFMGLWVPPLLAAEVHFEWRLEAPRLLGLIKRERISLLAAVPRVLELLRAHLTHLDPALTDRLASAQGASALRRWWRFRRVHRVFGLKFWAFVCGGATLPQELEQFWTGLGFALIQGYGMTETTALVTLNHPFHTARGSIGTPLAGREVEIAPDGEILVRGASIADREWRHGAMQPRPAREGGWLATGDLADRGTGGALMFTGRKSDIIVTAAGLNIHPQDLEDALLRQPVVRAATVVAETAGAAGPQPVAVLILRGDEGGQDAAAGRVVSAANAVLAAHQQIRRWLLWPHGDFPRTTTGKVLRREIAAWAAQTLAEGAAAAPPEHDSLLVLLRSISGVIASEHIGDESRLSEDLRLDSLGMVQMQGALESRFGVEIDDGAFSQARTVGDLRRLLQLPAGSAGHADMLAALQPRADAATRLTPAGPDRRDYPRWPWSAPVRWLRIAFLEAVIRPLTRLLLAPRVDRRAARIPARPPMLIIANHVTAFDVPLVLYALPGPVRRRVAVAMAAHLLLGWRHGEAERHRFLRLLTPVAYWLVTALFNVFPLPQGVGFRRSFAHAGEALDRGMHVLVFPEGRRSPDEAIGAFQSGIGLLAQESGTSVLPVLLEGLGEIKQRRRRWFRPGTVTIHVGDPVTMGAGEAAQAFTRRLEAAVRALDTAQESSRAASFAK